MEMLNVFQTLLGGLLGGGLIGLIEFLIRRKDAKEDKNSEVLQAIKKLDDKIMLLDRKIDSVDTKGDERNAISARIRILRFADEMMDDRWHSKDSWGQCMADITDYEKYCAEHPKFKNNQTQATVEYISEEYKERLQKRDFERKVHEHDPE